MLYRHLRDHPIPTPRRVRIRERPEPVDEDPSLRVQLRVSVATAGMTGHHGAAGDAAQRHYLTGQEEGFALDREVLRDGDRGDGIAGERQHVDDQVVGEGARLGAGEG